MSKAIQRHTSLQEAVTLQTIQFVDAMKGQQITGLYDMVLEQVERSLFQTTLEHCKYNQSKAARTLGISRGTFRIKLKKHFDDKYCDSKEANG